MRLKPHPRLCFMHALTPCADMALGIHLKGLAMQTMLNLINRESQLLVDRVRVLTWRPCLGTKVIFFSEIIRHKTRDYRERPAPTSEPTLINNIAVQVAEVASRSAPKTSKTVESTGVKYERAPMMRGSPFLRLKSHR